MTLFYPNGVLIQATDRPDDGPLGDQSESSPGFEEFRRYRGLAKYETWPLYFDDNPISQSLTAELDESWYNISPIHSLEFYKENHLHMVLHEKDLCVRYVQQCKIETSKPE